MSKETPRKTNKYLTPKEWAQAKALWESGELTMDELAAKFEVRRETLSRRFKKEGVTKGSKAEKHAIKMHDDLAKRLSEENEVLSKRIKQTKEDNFQWLSGLGRLTMKVIADARKADQPLSTVYPELKALEKAAQILRVTRGQLWEILGLDKDDIPDFADMPDLPITEMSALEIEELQQKSLDVSLGIVDEDDDDLLIGQANEDDGIVEEG